MRSASVCVCFLLITAAGAIEKPPRFAVNLDLPPNLRFEGAIDAVLSRHRFEDGFGPVFAEHNATLFNKLTPAQWEQLGTALEQHFPEHAHELKSISAQFRKAGYLVSYEYLCGWVYFHELAHTNLLSDASSVAQECTCILTQDDDGQVLHGGNMDQSPEGVRNVTLELSFFSKGKLEFKGVDWYWFTTGVSRAVKKNVGTFQENWRTTTARTLADVLSDISDGVTPQIFVFRQALSSSNTAAVANFDGALEAMSSNKLGAPYYVCMTGPQPGEAAIIARNLTGAEQVLRFGSADASNASTWFLAQTNYDHWKADPASDPRRSAAEKVLRQYGQADASTAIGLFSIVSTYPVHNPHTAYSVIMSAKTGDLTSFVRRAMCPEKAFGDGVTVDSRYCLAENRTQARP